MDDVHHPTMGIDPRNVHTSDGDGFEDTLQTVVLKIRARLPVEDRQQLIEEVDHAFKSASERPRPQCGRRALPHHTIPEPTRSRAEAPQQRDPRRSPHLVPGLRESPKGEVAREADFALKPDRPPEKVQEAPRPRRPVQRPPPNEGVS